jgi:hypothetical protein
MVRETIKKMRLNSHLNTMTHISDPDATKGLKLKFLDTVLSELGREMFKTEEEEAQEEQDYDDEEEKTNAREMSMTHNSSIHANDDLSVLNRNTLKPTAVNATKFSKFKNTKTYSACPSSYRANSGIITPMSPDSKASVVESKSSNKQNGFGSKSTRSRVESAQKDLQRSVSKGNDHEKQSHISKEESQKAESVPVKPSGILDSIM